MNTEKTPPHYIGHRERLRAKLERAGAEALEDYELLEILLGSLIPRRDVKPIAKALLSHFGGISGVFAADLRRLMEISGIGETTAIYLKTIHALHIRSAREEFMDSSVIASWSALLN